MDIRRSDLDNLTRLAELWKKTPGAEFEALLTGVDLTSWQDIVKYLRSLGMRENQQLIKMNISLSNNIRLTLEGSGAIQAYCRDNRIADKPFVAMLKEDIAGAETVNLNSYAARAKLKREIPLASTDTRVKEVLARWDSLDKHFRNIQRFEFTAPGGVPVRFDISIVRENAGRPARTFQEARVTTRPPRYEVEVELTAKRETTEVKAAVAHILRGLSWLLQGRQRSYVLVSQQEAEAVRASIGDIFGLASGGSERGRRGGSNRNRGGPQPAFRFPSPQPVTLERRHMMESADPAVPNLLSTDGGYNVTDKADGLRCLLFVSSNGMVFLVDGGGRVYATGKRTQAALKGLVLDGEWIRRDRAGTAVSHYMAFDILAKNADKGVANLPFKAPAGADSREAHMSKAVLELGAAKQVVKGVPATQDLQIGMKTFRTAAGKGIFTEAAEMLELAKSAIYNTDGLIFTPNKAPLPIGRGTWNDQLKWKPPHENTIDFLVIVDRERTKTSEPTAVEAVSTMFREDTGQTVRFKTLRLFVGSNRDVAFADPRRTILNGEELPRALHEGAWKEVEFRPTEPRDPMASVCYVAIDESGEESDIIRCARTEDIIQSDTIVEMAYYPERAPGWRWEPVRVRHDKTERWLSQQAEGGGRRGGTMNADWVANSIWSNIHNPVSEEAITTGRITECVAPAALNTQLGYTVRRTPMRDLMKTQCMRNFHNEYIRRRILLGTVLKAGVTVCDLAMGRGEDIPKWIAAGVRSVIGCDAAAASLNSPTDGAYSRLLDKMIALGGRDKVPPMVFIQADISRRLLTGDAGLTPDDTALLKHAFARGGDMESAGGKGADVVSCMFAASQLFRDENTLLGLLNNLADTVKVGGLFVGCGLDGDAVARAFVAAQGQSTIMGRDGAIDTWAMTRHYSADIGSAVPPTAAGLGLSVDVDFIAEGERSTEYLVSWPYFQARLAEAGIELLTPEELGILSLPASTQMFSETWEAADTKYNMTASLQRLSFMNRWWIMRRRSDRRPAPPTAPPPTALLPTAPPPTATAPVPLAPLPTADLIDFTQLETPPSTRIDFTFDAPKRAPIFIVNGDERYDRENRLGDPSLADWPRYLSLVTLHEIPDMKNPAVKYPSVFAAIQSAIYQLSTDKPALGPAIFSTNGKIHKYYEEERAKLVAAGQPTALQEKTIDEETNMMREQASPDKMNKYKAIWDKAKWGVTKPIAYKTYLAERFATDSKFRAILQSIKSVGGKISYIEGRDANTIGDWMMELTMA